MVSADPDEFAPTGAVLSMSSWTVELAQAHPSKNLRQKQRYTVIKLYLNYISAFLK